MTLLQWAQPADEIPNDLCDQGIEYAKEEVRQILEDESECEYLDYELPSDDSKQWLPCSKAEYEQYKASGKLVRRFVILEG